MSEYIEVKKLNKYFGDVHAVQDLSFQIPKGKIVAIIGPNGSGKSTVVKMMVGLIEPSSGTIQIGAKDPKAARSLFGYVPQRFQFDHSLPVTVKEFLTIAQCGTGEHSSLQSVQKVLEQVSLEEKTSELIGSLSGGQLQRLLIARALLHKKEILILDEPSAGIDVSSQKQLYTLLEQLNTQEGTTIIVVSHALESMLQFAQTVLCMNKQQVCYGAAKEMLKNPKIMKQLYGSQHSHTHI